jgi:hypothetical protein
MTNDIFSKYGACVLPKNKLLWSFQRRKWQPNQDEVFALIDQNQTWDNARKFTLQTKCELNLVAPFDISLSLTGVTHLHKIYDEIMDMPLLDKWKKTLSFKEEASVRRPFLHELEKLGVDGWIHPVESDIYRIEVCIVRSDNLEIVPNVKKLDQKMQIVPGSISHNLTCHHIHTRMIEYHKAYLRHSPLAWSPLEHLRLLH